MLPAVFFFFLNSKGPASVSKLINVWGDKEKNRVEKGGEMEKKMGEIREQLARPVVSSQPAKKLMMSVMRPRGVMSTSLTLRLPHSPWKGPLAALAHLLWSYIRTQTENWKRTHSSTLQAAKSGARQQEEDEKQIFENGI